MNILLSVITTLAVLITGFNTVSFDQTKYLSKEYWLNSAKLGAFTELASTNQLSAFPTTYNANLAKTLEVGTTSVASITTLPGLTSASALTTIGTITAGAWQANTLQSDFGGTGTTSLAKFRIVLGNGTASTTVATSTGSAGYVFMSSGEGLNPSWQALPPTNEASNYVWTGLHSWSQPMNASSTLSVNQKLNVSTSTPDQTVNLAVNGGALISATTTVGGLIATTSINNVSGMFSSSATSTFAGGIQLSAGCFKDSVGCVNTKYFSYATDTPALITNTFDDTRTTNFQPTYMSGVVFMDAASDSDIYCSFTWTASFSLSLGQLVSTGVDSSSNSTLCTGNQGTDDATITINSTSATGFTVRFTGTGGNYGDIKMNMVVMGN